MSYDLTYQSNFLLGDGNGLLQVRYELLRDELLSVLFGTAMNSAPTKLAYILILSKLCKMLLTMQPQQHFNHEEGRHCRIQCGLSALCETVLNASVCLQSKFLSNIIQEQFLSLNKRISKNASEKGPKKVILQEIPPVSEGI